jgi:hypothetical protein
LVLEIPALYLTLLVPSSYERIGGNAFPTTLALAIQSPQPLYRDNVSGHRARNDRVARSGVDREVKGDSPQPLCVFAGWPWRFTLRSLFVVTTFLAIVPGMIAWLDRAWIGK